MSGFTYVGMQDVIANADEIVVNTSATDVRPNTTTVNSDTRSILAYFPGTSLTVVWNSKLLLAGAVVQVTPIMDSPRIRTSYTITTSGTVTIRRSSGSVVDEEFVATIEGNAV